MRETLLFAKSSCRLPCTYVSGAGFYFTALLDDNCFTAETKHRTEDLSVVNYYELLATCSKYSIDASDMSENINKQTIYLYCKR